jgi:hypothetical protein
MVHARRDFPLARVVRRPHFLSYNTLPSQSAGKEDSCARMTSTPPQFPAHHTPTTNTRAAKTDPVIDEWIHQVQSDIRRKPDEVWEYEDWFTDSCVKVTKAWSSGNLITRLSILYD